MNKCPYCNKKGCVPNVVMRNTESYDNNIHKAKCSYCHKRIEIVCHRKVVIDDIQKTEDSSDYSNIQMEM